MCMCLTAVTIVIVVYETSGQFVNSLGREGQREGKFFESLNIHTVSPLVLMGSFMCVITIEFRYCSLFSFCIHNYIPYVYYT